MSIIFLIATGLAVLCATPFRLYAPPPACTVQNTSDSGPGSLREALANATNGETITFCPGVTGTIILTNGELVISNSVVIIGPGADVLTVSGNNSNRVFFVGPGAPGATNPPASGPTIFISDLTIADGQAKGGDGGVGFTLGGQGGGGGGMGGGIFINNGVVSLSGIVFTNNHATGGTGGTPGTAGFGGGLGGGGFASNGAGAGSGNGGSGGAGGNLGGAGGAGGTTSVSGPGGPGGEGGGGGGGGTGNISGSPGGPGGAGGFGGAGGGGGTGSSAGGLGGHGGLGGGGGGGGPSGSGGAVGADGGTFAGNGGRGGVVGPNVSGGGGGGGAGLGGAIFARLGLVTLQHCTFNNNSAVRGAGGTPLGTAEGGTDGQGKGGALFINPAVTGCINDIVFSGNTATDAGSTVTDTNDVYGVLLPNTFTVVNTLASGPGSLRQAILEANATPCKNLITFAPSAYGTITLTNGELLITGDVDILGPGPTNVAVSGNAASRVFHVITNHTVTIAGLTITHGSASGGFGGGIWNDHAFLIVSNCVITGNSAAQAGGINNDGGGAGSASMFLVNSTVSSNSSVASGAGIRNYGVSGRATLMVANSTVSGNSASAGGGGGIYNLGTGGGLAELTILNSTLSENSGPSGSGIVNLGDDVDIAATARLMIGSTILNASISPIITNIFGSVFSLGYNLSSDDGSGFLTSTGDQTNTNPLLGPLQLNGGETPTHALLCNTPAVEAGTNFLGLANDQRGLGFPRTFGAATDIGAFELQQECNLPPVAVCTNVTVSADSNCVANASIDNGSHDPDDGDSITNSVQSPAGPYILGTNLVTLTVTDSHGASSSCTGFVFVVDTTLPTIHCPTNMVVNNDTGQCSAVVTYTVTADDNCSSVSLSEDFPSGSTFSNGTNTVTVTGVDLAGNTNTCTFTVTVLDKETPLVMCRPAPNPSGKVTVPGKPGSSTNANPNGYYQVLAKDNCDASPEIYVKDTGSTFVAGPFKDGDIVRLKRAGKAPSSVAGTAPIVAVISLKGNGLAIAKDAVGNITPNVSGCVLPLSVK